MSASAEEELEGGQQDHERRGRLLPRQRPEAVGQGPVEDDGLLAPVVARRRGAREIARELERRKPGQLAVPVGELGNRLLAAERVLLPAGEVRVL
jgi:hypothetical protein